MRQVYQRTWSPHGEEHAVSNPGSPLSTVIDTPQADAIAAGRRWAGLEEVDMSIAPPLILTQADAVLYTPKEHPYPCISSVPAPGLDTSVTPDAMMLPVFSPGPCSTPRQYRCQYWYHSCRSQRRLPYRSHRRLIRPLAPSSFFGAVGCPRLIRPT